MKQKIKTYFYKAELQKNTLDSISSVNTENEANIKSANKYYDSIKTPFLYESSWSTMEYYSASNSIGIEWDIDLGEIPSRYIPFINCQVIHKTPNKIIYQSYTNEDDETISTRNISSTIFYFLDTHLHSVTHFLVDLYADDDIHPPNTEAKLIISIYNPSTYI